MFCKNCGAANQDGARFCAGCGADLMAAPVQQAPVQPTYQAPVQQAPVQQPYSAPAQPYGAPAQRPAGAPVTLNPAMIMNILVVVVMILGLIFGIMNTFGTYELEGTVKTVTKDLDGKKDDDDYEIETDLEDIYESQKDLKDEKEDAKDTEDEWNDMLEEAEMDADAVYEFKGGFLGMQIGNIVYGIVCFLIVIVGALYLLKVFQRMPYYDQFVGKIAKGKSPAFLMSAAGAVFALIHIVLVFVSTVTQKIEIPEELAEELWRSNTMEQTTMSYAPHWTSWFALVVFVLVLVYDQMILNKNKKR